MPPQQPVAPPATFDAVRDGIVDISVAVTDWTPTRHVLDRIAEFPGADSLLRSTQSPLVGCISDSYIKRANMRAFI